MFKKLSFVLALLMLSVTPVMAQVDFCEGNFNYDQDVDGSDASMFKSDFGRSSFDRPCPGGFAAVAKTGSTQAQSTYGWDDGCLQEGVPSPNPRFTDHGDGTVTDNMTGLMWTKNAENCGGAAVDWKTAMDCIAAQYNWPCYAGYCDWVLPNVKQWLSLIDYGQELPALPLGHPFDNAFAGIYWSSTSQVYETWNAYGVVLQEGTVYLRHKTLEGGYVWPVRGGYDFLGKCVWE